MPWQQAIESGLKQKIVQKKLPVRLFVEYVDAGRFPLAETSECLYRLFRAKYGIKHIDMVISEGFPAAEMLYKTADLFPKARKLLVRTPSPKHKPREGNLWRIVTHEDYTRAIREMMRLVHPQKLAVIADVSDSHGKRRLEDFKNSLREAGVNLPVTYLTGPTLRYIAEQTSKLPPNSAIYYLLYFRDGQGNRLTPHQFIKRVAATANAPIFTHWETILGSGVLGGYVLSAMRVGGLIGDAVAAHVAHRPWPKNGESAVQVEAMFENQFDWRELQRWRIAESSLPENSRILFRTPGLLEAYPVEAGVLIAFIAALSLLATALLLEMRRRKKTARNLEQSRRQLNAIFQASPNPVVVYDSGQQIMFSNPEFRQLFGWSGTDAPDWRFPFVHPSHREDMRAMSWRVAGGGGPARLEARGLAENQIPLDLIASAALVRGPGKGGAGLVLAFTDISEQNAMQEQLRQSQKMESIGTLAGGVAHDFNNLLSVIIGYTELAMDELPPESSLGSSLEQVLQSSLKARTLVAQLLAFSRKQVLTVNTFTFNDLIKKNQSMLGRIIGEDIDLRLSLAPDAGFVRADFNQVEQVVFNLVANARDAMPDGGSITLETANVVLDELYTRTHADVAAGAYVMLSVSDTGPGIEKAIMDKIFDPFFTTKELGKGTGMGLATVHGIVKQHGGNVCVYSEPGHGTAFKVYLPLAEEKPDISGEPSASTELARGSETIMVVEDENAVRGYVVKALRRLGYRVFEASNGLDALRLSEELAEPLHLLVTDVVMPQMNGKQLFGRLAQMRPGLKVLYISGYSDNVIVHHGVLEDGAAFLQKPLSLVSLSAKLRQVLES